MVRTEGLDYRPKYITPRLFHLSLHVPLVDTLLFSSGEIPGPNKTVESVLSEILRPYTDFRTPNKILSFVNVTSQTDKFICIEVVPRLHRQNVDRHLSCQD